MRTRVDTTKRRVPRMSRHDSAITTRLEWTRDEARALIAVGSLLRREGARVNDGSTSAGGGEEERARERGLRVNESDANRSRGVRIERGSQSMLQFVE